MAMGVRHCHRVGLVLSRRRVQPGSFRGVYLLELAEAVKRGFLVSFRRRGRSKHRLLFLRGPCELQTSGK